jgi:hypothetical protein
MPTEEQTQQTATRPVEARDVVARLESMLDFWRTHVDEFLVQLDLAHLEIRDRIAGHEDAAEAFGARLERRIAEFRRGLAEQREAVVGIQQDLRQSALAGETRTRQSGGA